MTEPGKKPKRNPSKDTADKFGWKAGDLVVVKQPKKEATK